jgi:DNA-nicking Smr family endonuclease
MLEDDDTPVAVPIEDAIDLHSFAPRDVISVVDEYLHAARDAGFTDVRLIHGRGKGVQRADIQRLLREHPLVERYWDAPESHLGATLVRLRRDPHP